MACAGCSVAGKSGGCSSGGCNSTNGCSSGGCNKLNTFDWLSKLDLPDLETYDVVEVSFKNGSRKEFFHNPPHLHAVVGDDVVVEVGVGYDIGRISLTGELVKMQHRKKRLRDSVVFGNIIRKANQRDLERLEDARQSERDTMVKARAIARALDLDMKIGDVEYQGDGRKATFFYTANGRVDFRELIRHYAKEFKVKIEMRQIGARQESARIGGLGSCGRELCCSTWLSDFKSVNTTAARYQNLAINQTKLSGQCGRLKCCLNFELDTYIDALEQFPKKADRLFSKEGVANLLKIDVFKKQMHYLLSEDAANGRTKLVTLDVSRVVELLEMNRRHERPEQLVNIEDIIEKKADMDFADVTGEIELPEMERRSRNRNKNKNRNKGGGAASEDKREANVNTPKQPKQPQHQPTNRPPARVENKLETQKQEKTNKPQQHEQKNTQQPKPINKDNNRPPRSGNGEPISDDSANTNRPPQPKDGNKPPQKGGKKFFNKKNQPPKNKDQ